MLTSKHVRPEPPEELRRVFVEPSGGSKVLFKVQRLQNRTLMDGILSFCGRQSGGLQHQRMCETCMADDPAAIAKFLLKKCLAVFTFEATSCLLLQGTHSYSGTAVTCFGYMKNILTRHSHVVAVSSNVSITLICQLVNTDVCSIAEYLCTAAMACKAALLRTLVAHTW